MVPNSDGGRHRPDYVAEATILAQDVHLSNDIAMSNKPAGVAAVQTAPRLRARSAGGALLAGVGFILRSGHEPAALARLVGQVMPRPTQWSLMQPLIVHCSFIVAHPDVAHVAHHQCAHASCVERGDRPGGELMLDVPDLMIDLAQHSALGVLESFPPTAASAFLGEAGLEARGNLVPVPPFGPQQAAIENQRKALGADRGVVHLAEIGGADVPDLLGDRWHFVGGPQFMLGPIPSDLDLDREIIAPVGDHKGRCSPGVGQQQTAIFDTNRRCFPDDLEEPLSLVGRLEIRVECAGLAPPVKGTKEALDRGLSGLRMEDSGLAIVQAALHGPLRQPPAMAADMPPEPDDCVSVDGPRRVAQSVDLREHAEFPFPDDVHGPSISNLCSRGNCIRGNRRASSPLVKQGAFVLDFGNSDLKSWSGVWVGLAPCFERRFALVRVPSCPAIETAALNPPTNAESLVGAPTRLAAESRQGYRNSRKHAAHRRVLRGRPSDGGLPAHPSLRPGHYSLESS